VADNPPPLPPRKRSPLPSAPPNHEAGRFIDPEAPTTPKGIEHLAALLVRYYAGSSNEDQGRILKYAEECFNRNQG